MAVPPAAATPRGRIPAGSVVTLKSIDKVCTDKNKVGDRFTAAVQQEVMGANGATIPKGAIATFVVDRLVRGSESKNQTLFTVSAESIHWAGATYPLSASTDTVVIKRKSNGLLGAVVGAAAGIAATKAAGGSTGDAVAIGVAGGAAGAAVGSQLGKGDGCIEKDALMRVTLRGDVTP